MSATTMPAPTALTVPPMKGQAYGGWLDLRHRIWTAANGLRFDDVPTSYEGGPAEVPLDGWHLSAQSTTRFPRSASLFADDRGPTTIRVWRGNPATGERHPLDGTEYVTGRDADRAAYKAGLIGFMVYDKDAADYGLPTA